MSCDPVCYDLARLFLQDLKGVTVKDIAELAADVQRLCEDACNAIEDRPSPRDRQAP